MKNKTKSHIPSKETIDVYRAAMMEYKKASSKYSKIRRGYLMIKDPDMNARAIYLLAKDDYSKACKKFRKAREIWKTAVSLEKLKDMKDIKDVKDMSSYEKVNWLLSVIETLQISGKENELTELETKRALVESPAFKNILYGIEHSKELLEKEKEDIPDDEVPFEN